MPPLRIPQKAASYGRYHSIFSATHALSSVAHGKFVQYIGEAGELKGAPTPTDEEQRQMIRDAGFVDIQVFQKWCDFGTYTNGMRVELRSLITLDQDAKRAGVVARFAHGANWPLVGMTFTQIEDVDERRAFTERAINALCSGTEPFALLR